MSYSGHLIAAIFLALILDVYCNTGRTNVDVPARIGDSVELSCSFSHRDGRSQISWKFNDELIVVGSLKFTNNNRIRIARHGTIAISPVQREDIGLYVCYTDDDYANEQHFTVREVYSEREGSQNGYPQIHVQPTTVRPHYPGRENIRDREQQRSDECCNEPERRLTQKLDQIIQLLQQSNTQCEQVNERIYSIESAQVRIEQYIRSLSSNQYPPPQPATRPTRTTFAYPIIHTTNAPPPPTRYPYPRYTPRHTRATTTQRPPIRAYYRRALPQIVDGQRVQEYTWAIRNFNDEIDTANLDGTHMLKTYFLTGYAGYNMSIRVYPNRDSEGYIGVFAGVAPGLYDDGLEWPFRQHYELTFVSHRSSVSDYTQKVVPFVSRCPADTFNRRTYDDGASCGYSKFMSHAEFRQKSYAYLTSGGSLNVRVRICECHRDSEENENLEQEHQEMVY